MASKLSIQCPECDKSLEVPVALVGNKIRCKECRHVFKVPDPDLENSAPKASSPRSASPAKNPPSSPGAKKQPSPPGNQDHDDANPYGITDMDFLPRCPFCAKELQSEEDLICLNCGYNTQTRNRVEAKKTYETTPMDVFIWLLPGILAAVGLLLMIGCLVILWVFFPDWQKQYKDEWWSFFLGLWARIWGSVIVTFIGFYLAKQAFHRLVMDPIPPEKVKYK